jgi:hypothetical protein
MDEKIINRKLDRNRTLELFEANGRVTIQNFLQDQTAERVHLDFESLSSRSLWFRSHLGDGTYWNSKSTASKDPKFSSYSFGKYPLKPGTALDMVHTGSTRFDAHNLKLMKGNLVLNELGRRSTLLKVSRYLMSSEGSKLIQGLTGEKLLPSATTLSATRYVAGDFCSPHTDLAPRRTVAFILHLTKAWPVQWGGQLAILDSKFSKVIDIINPAFNSLTIFKVPLPHAVIGVAAQSTKSRYAITGWYGR